MIIASQNFSLSWPFVYNTENSNTGTLTYSEDPDQMPLYVAPRESTLIFSCICRHFLGFKILNFNIFGGFQKNEFFGGCEDFVDIFWGSSQK